MTIEVRVEGPRGCGHRKEGGLYLIGGRLSAPCGRMPLPLPRCGACGHGVKPTRGWTWLRPKEVLGALPPCPFAGEIVDATCYLGGAMPERAGLLWIGEAFYKAPQDFLLEAREHGISRRLTAIPRGFEVGRDVVLLAHRRACPPEWGEEDQSGRPGIFAAFTPSRIEKVVPADTSAEEEAALREKGIVPIVVEPANEWPEPAPWAWPTTDAADLR